MPRRMWKFLIGCVTIQIEGLYPEVLINEISAKYKLRGVRRQGHTRVELTVRAAHAEKIWNAATRRGMQCRILKKDLPMRAMEQLFCRWWIPLTAVILLTCAVWCAGCCFTIEIIGNETLSEFAICELLRQNGIAAGMRKSEIDLLRVKNALYREYSSLAYAEVRFDGTALQIILQEGKEIPELLSHEPCTIVAEKRGVIRSVTVGEGVACVEPGDSVAAGDPLILGAYQKKEKDFLVHARGRVMAQVEYFADAEISLKTGLVRTGNSAKVRYLCTGNMKIPLSGENPYELFEEELLTEKIVPENMPAYLRIEDVIYYECRRGVTDELRAAAEIALREEAYYAALKQLPEDAQILDFYSMISEEKNTLYAVATVTVLEEIGREIPAELENREDTVTRE